MTRPAPLFTIVVPTRERADTLVHTLRTCAAQAYPNLEILVSDNVSQDNTRAVVEACGDARVRYVNPGRRLGMSAHWEFALNQVRPGYVSYIGDDDGFLPRAVADSMRLLEARQYPPVLAWSRAVYYWPGYVEPHRQKLLYFSTRTDLLSMRAAEWLDKLGRLQVPWSYLPSIYAGAIHTDVLAEVRRRGNGRFFNSPIPDVYSAIAIASVVDDYVYSMRPYTLAGLSRHSTGSSFYNLTRDPSAAQAFLSENTEITIHPRLVMSSLASVCIMEGFLQARDCGLLPAGPPLDMAALIEAALREASEQPEAEYAQVLAQVRAIAAKNDLAEWAETAIRDALRSPVQPRRAGSVYDLRRRCILLDGERLKLDNVADAAAACDRVLRGGYLGHINGWETLQYTVRDLAPAALKRLKRLARRLRP